MLYDKENIFAKIIRGQIPATKIYEDETTIAFNDIAPAAPIHILVIPKGEYISFHDFVEKAGAQEIDNFFKNIRKIAVQLGLEEDGYRIITNNGKKSGQSVFHFHVHILAGKELTAL